MEEYDEEQNRQDYEDIVTEDPYYETEEEEDEDEDEDCGCCGDGYDSDDDNFAAAFLFNLMMGRMYM